MFINDLCTVHYISFFILSNFLENYFIKYFTNEGKKNLIIFDDIQDYPTKNINKLVARFRDEVLRNGRSLGIYTIYVNHKPNAGFDTAEQIFESTAVVMFPKQAGFNDYDRMMTQYLGIKNSDVKILKNARSKYVYVSKSQPAYAVTDNYVLVL